MEDHTFNAKNSRAQKLRRDKCHEKHHKPVTKEGTKSTKDNPKPLPAASKTLEGNIEKTSQTSTVKPENEHVSSVDSNKLFSKRVLASNWGRYEKELDSCLSDSEESLGANFDELINIPITAGHFKLKHECDWDKERAEIQAPWFQLDLDRLNNSLSSIPFFKRQGLPSNLFTDEKLHQMNVRASQYAAPLKNATELSKSILSQSSDSDQKQSTSGVSLDREIFGSSDETESNNDEDLEKVLSFGHKNVMGALSNTLEAVTFSSSHQGNETLTSNEQSAVSPPVMLPAAEPIQPISSSLDDWLDSILDD